MEVTCLAGKELFIAYNRYWKGQVLPEQYEEEQNEEDKQQNKDRFFTRSYSFVNSNVSAKPGICKG